MKKKQLRLFLMLMKFSIYGFVIQTLSFTLLIAANSNAQQVKSVKEYAINLHLKDAGLEEIFKEIENKTNYTFHYDRKIINRDFKTSITGRNKTVYQYLVEISEASQLNFKQMNAFISVYRVKEGQESKQIEILLQSRNITGKVTSFEDGEGLPGVNVVEKGTSNGTITNVKGEYSLEVAEEAVLVFSSVGYTTEEIEVGNQSVVDLVMTSDIQQLQELVVIGYGTRSKRDVTTAISEIDSEDITKRMSMTPEMAMQGQMSGVQVIGNNGDPNARPTIRIRGTNSWGVSDPLYVIDGVPVEEYGAGVEGAGGSYVRGGINIMSLIDPNDIESISVLKDASAGAIYGVRASNGVVLITTKKGRKEKQPRISFSNRIGISNVTQRVDLLKTQEFTDHVNALYASDPTSEDIRHPLNDVFRPDHPSYLGESPTYDWQDAILNKNAMTQEYNLSVSGGSQTADYYVSFGYSDQEGIFIGSDMRRLSGSVKLNFDITDYIRTGINYRISHGKGNNANTGAHISSLAHVSLTPPWQPIYDPDGINGYAKVVEGFNEEGVWSSDKLYGLSTRNNVLGMLSMVDNFNHSLRQLGNVYLEIEPIENLTFKGSLSMDMFNNGVDAFGLYNSSYFQYDGSDPTPLGGPSSVGNYERRNMQNFNLVYEFTGNYIKSFGDHDLDILVNSMIQEYTADFQSAGTDYVTSTNRDLVHLGGERRFTRAGGFTERGARVGFLFRSGYNYASKYYLDFTVRRDGSSKFAPEYRWGIFPAVSAAWRISQESFMEPVSWIDDLKFRAGWGELGNEEVPPYAFLSLINTAPNYAWGNNPQNIGYGYTNSAATVFSMPNPELLWERTATFNIGFDSRLFNSIDLSFEYYDKYTEGLLQSITLPASAGIIDAPQANIGDVRNNGIELNINYSGQIGELSYSVGGNFTSVRNEVLKTYKGIPLDNIEEGYSLNYIRGYQVGGIFQTDAEAQEYMANITDDFYEEPRVTAGDMYFQDLRGAPKPEDIEQGINEFYSPEPDGIVDNYDRVFLGKTIPGHYYGGQISADYKGIDFSMQYTGVGDVQKVNSIRQSLGSPYNIGLNRTREVLNAWTSENTDTNVPRIMFGDPASNMRFSDYFVEDGGYFRLTNLQIGYTFPKSVYKATNNILRNFRIYGGVSNPLTITGYSGLDPEDDSNPAPLIYYTGLSVQF